MYEEVGAVAPAPTALITTIMYMMIFEGLKAPLTRPKKCSYVRIDFKCATCHLRPLFAIN